MKFVLGTGRCGTTRYAEVHGGEHEPHPDLLVPLGCLYAAGVVSDRLAMELLRNRDWSDLTAIVPLQSSTAGKPLNERQRQRNFMQDSVNLSKGSRK